jgi:zona occludens toxin
MIHFLSATPGSGKTLWATDYIYKLSKLNIKNLNFNYYYAKSFFEKITQLGFDSYLASYLLEEGQGLEQTKRLVFLESNFFDFLKNQYYLNVVLDGESDELSENFPPFYYERVAILNKIIEQLNEDKNLKFTPFLPVRTIYTNISDLRLAQARPLPLNCDWRTTPQGSYFVIDECQLIDIFHEDARKLDDIVKDLTIHRKLGYDFLFISQDPTFVNKYIRKLASLHIHLINIFGWEQSMKLEWSTVQDAPNAVRNLARAENVSRWMFPKYAYKLYKSTTINTRKKRYPRKLIIVCVLVALVFFAWLIMAMNRKTDSTLVSVATGNGLNFDLNQEKKNDKSNTRTDKTADASKSGSALDTSSASEPTTNAPSKDSNSNGVVNAITDADGNVIPSSQPEPVYNPADPYSYNPVSKPAVVNHRVFSGCVSYSGKHYAVDQQGTLIKQFSASDCKKLLDKSYNRPFDYFGNRTPPPSPPETTTAENESTTYKQSLIENIARLDAEKQHRSQNPQVRTELVPIDSPKSKYLDSANRY